MSTPDTTVSASVVHRTGPLTLADYDEAIALLQDAKGQLQPNADNCHVCGDSMCWAGTCHHNPLVRAREALAKQYRWRCFHCNEMFDDFESAEAHFGTRETEVARCLTA